MYILEDINTSNSKKVMLLTDNYKVQKDFLKLLSDSGWVGLRGEYKCQDRYLLIINVLDMRKERLSWFHDLGGRTFDTFYVGGDLCLTLDEFNYCCSRLRSEDKKFFKVSLY